jgi:hypothetical protein
MNSKFRSMFILLLLITFQPANSQDTCCCLNEELTYEQALSGELFTQPLDINTFFNKEWLLGRLVMSNGEIIQKKNIRYNGLLDELFWQEPGSKNTIKLDKESIQQFHFLNFGGDTSVIFEKIKVKRDLIADSLDVFAQEIYQGSLSLYILHDFVFDHREVLSLDKGLYQKTLYAGMPVYYFKFLNNSTIGLKHLNLKNLNNLVPGKEEQLKKYFRENIHGRIQTRSDLVELTRFLSSIVSQ